MYVATLRFSFIGFVQGWQLMYLSVCLTAGWCFHFHFVAKTVTTEGEKCPAFHPLLLVLSTLGIQCTVFCHTCNCDHTYALKIAGVSEKNRTFFFQVFSSVFWNTYLGSTVDNLWYISYLKTVCLCVQKRLSNFNWHLWWLSSETLRSALEDVYNTKLSTI